MNNIGYHTRLDRDNRVKVIGGSFGGTLCIDTANRLVNAHFEVKIKPSGRAVFVDREGREVSLYMSINPDMTIKGQKVIKAYQEDNYRKEQENLRNKEDNEDTIQELMQGLTYEEIISKLSSK